MEYEELVPGSEHYAFNVPNHHFGQGLFQSVPTSEHDAFNVPTRQLYDPPLHLLLRPEGAREAGIGGVALPVAAGASLRG